MFAQMPVQFVGSGLDGFDGAVVLGLECALVAMLLAATNADNGCGEHWRESELLGTIDNLVWLLSIDECFRNDKTGAHGADSRFG